MPKIFIFKTDDIEAYLNMDSTLSTEITWLPPEEGGRKNGAPIGAEKYAPLIKLHPEDEARSIWIKNIKPIRELVTTADIGYLVSEKLPIDLIPNTKFWVYEGSRIVANGRVIGYAKKEKLDKSLVFGELAYLILHYEKQRIKNGFWNRKYRTELRASISLCLDLVKSLSHEAISEGDTELIRKASGHPAVKLCRNAKILDSFELVTERMLHPSERASVNKAAQILLGKILSELKMHSPHYKKHIARDLFCLDNIPKFYLSATGGGYLTDASRFANIKDIKRCLVPFYTQEEADELFIV